MKHLVEACLILLVASACSDPHRPTEAVSSAVPLPFVSVEPPDLTSVMRGTPIRVRIWRTGGEIPDSTVSTVGDSIEAFVGDRKIPVLTKVLDRPDSLTDDANYSEVMRDISVTPTDWTSGWLEIRVTIPNGLVVPHRWSVSPVDEGQRFKARLNSDEAAVARLLELCETGKGDVKGSLSFSENVSVDSATARIPIVRLGDVACDPLLTNAEAEKDPDAEVPTAMATTSRLYFSCAASSLGDASVSVSLENSRSATGGSVTFFGLDTYERTLLAADAWSPMAGCLNWNL